VARRTLEVTRNAIVRYQGASGDFNPVHHDDEVARATGYPGAFTVGMLPAAVLGTLVREWRPDGHLRDISVRFLSQTWPGDVLQFAATLEAIAEEGPDRLVTLGLSCVRQTGDAALSGRAEVVFRP
jgi:acyl dehydratase